MGEDLAGKDHGRRTGRPGPDAPAPSPRIGGRLFVPLVLVPAFAVLVGALLYYGASPVHHWFVTDVVEPGGVRAVSVRVAVNERVYAGPVRTGERSELGLQLGDLLRLWILPATAIDLPKGPGRWLSRRRAVRLERGEVFGTMEGGEGSPTAVFETVEGRGIAREATFAVLRAGDTTSFCLWSGGLEVFVGTEPSRTREVPEKMKLLIFGDGRPSRLVPLDERERRVLSEVRDGGMADVPE